jgi:hypothetical protein
LISNTDSRSVVKTLLENSNKILIPEKDSKSRNLISSTNSRSRTFILLEQEIVSKVQMNEKANKGF